MYQLHFWWFHDQQLSFRQFHFNHNTRGDNVFMTLTILMDCVFRKLIQIKLSRVKSSCVSQCNGRPLINATAWLNIQIHLRLTSVQEQFIFLWSNICGSKTFLAKNRWRTWVHWRNHRQYSSRMVRKYWKFEKAREFERGTFWFLMKWKDDEHMVIYIIEEVAQVSKCHHRI